MKVAGIGRIVFWSGGSLWIGQAVAPTELHAHHAIQLCFALSDVVHFRTSEAAAWRSYGGAAIPSDVAHAFQAPGKLVAHIFCEPESAQGRGLLARFGRDMIAGMDPGEAARHAGSLRAGYLDGLDDEDLEHLALEALYALSGQAGTGAVDERIHRATALVGARIAEPLALEEAARHVGLSPGRFRHLFVAETGIPFRAYLLWTRLNRALELGFGGRSWTEAAHATGFADSAHLSRTARRMYGVAPSSLRREPPLRSMSA